MDLSIFQQLVLKTVHQIANSFNRKVAFQYHAGFVPPHHLMNIFPSLASLLEKSVRA